MPQMCKSKVKIQTLKWLKKNKNIIQNVYRKGCYLTANKHLLQKSVWYNILSYYTLKISSMATT